MTGDDVILVQILDDSGGDHCSGCSPPWPARKLAEGAAEYLERIYGEAVRVDFIDLAEVPLASSPVHLAEQVRSQGLVLPVVAINGKFRLSGVLDYGRIADAIETLREVSYG